MVGVGGFAGRQLPEAQPEPLASGLAPDRRRRQRKPGCSRGWSKLGRWMLGVSSGTRKPTRGRHRARLRRRRLVAREGRHTHEARPAPGRRLEAQVQPIEERLHPHEPHEVAERDVHVDEVRAPERPERFLELFARVAGRADVVQLQPARAVAVLALRRCTAGRADPWGGRLGTCTTGPSSPGNGSAWSGSRAAAGPAAPFWIGQRRVDAEHLRVVSTPSACRRARGGGCSGRPK